VLIDSFLEEADKYRVFMDAGIDDADAQHYAIVNRYSVRVFSGKQSQWLEHLHSSWSIEIVDVLYDARELGLVRGWAT
jgi:hypothetical protein